MATNGKNGTDKWNSQLQQMAETVASNRWVWPDDWNSWLKQSVFETDELAGRVKQLNETVKTIFYIDENKNLSED